MEGGKGEKDWSELYVKTVGEMGKKVEGKEERAGVGGNKPRTRKRKRLAVSHCEEKKKEERLENAKARKKG